MHLSPSSRIHRGVGSLVALGLLAACAGDPVGPIARGPSLGVADGSAPPDVVICHVGPEGTSNTFQITASNAGGVLPLGSTVTLPAYPTLEAVNASGCVVVWGALYPSPVDGAFTDVTVTEINMPSTLTLLRIVAYDRFGEQWLEPAPASRAVTMSVNYDNPGRAYFKHDGTQPPPPGCNGLTPGYWKNWRNHYTTAQFTTMIQGTIAGSIAEADAILKAKEGGSSSAIVKLRKFILANQLTLNLMANPGFPNPDDAELSLGCTTIIGGPDLASALATALQMHANPSAYSALQILDIKDQLDALANLD